MLRFIQKPILAVFAVSLLFSASCKKPSDAVQVSAPAFQVGQAVSDAAPLCGSIKGTMLSGKTYTINCDVIVNVGDTLLIQSGVKVLVASSASITVKGTFISLGTKAAPNWITVPNVTKADNIGQNPATDPAFAGKWEGINCDTTCKLCVIKWTHVEFSGATLGTIPVSGLTTGTPSFDIFFQNPKGVFVLEDSWIYGTVDDAVRVTDGKVSIMRNTFEKTGFNSGEALNVKSGTVGDIAYNLFVGSATNGCKESNAGATPVQANLNTYNNTYVDCGFRQTSQSGHGGSVNYEKQVKGQIYNNLIVNCKIGLRVVNTADTINITYGNTYNYGDSLSVVNQFYPVGNVTHPMSTDMPAPSSFLPAGYKEGDAYNGTAAIGAGNPKFVNFPLPNANFAATNFVGSSDFHIQSGSPCIGKGNTSFSPLAVVPVSANFGATEITLPGPDAGCYQSSGKGNQH